MPRLHYVPQHAEAPRGVDQITAWCNYHTYAHLKKTNCSSTHSYMSQSLYCSYSPFLLLSQWSNAHSLQMLRIKLLAYQQDVIWGIQYSFLYDAVCQSGEIQQQRFYCICLPTCFEPCFNETLLELSIGIPQWRFSDYPSGRWVSIAFQLFPHHCPSGS